MAYLIRFLVFTLLAAFFVQAAPSLTSGKFKIMSLTEGNPPLSINLILPSYQDVYLNGPVKTWNVRSEGNDVYLLSVGGYPFTGIVDGVVIASIHPEQNVKWRVTYREANDAYTIEPADSVGSGFTVDHIGGGNPRIIITPIMSTKSLPPRYFPTQLFRFERAE